MAAKNKKFKKMAIQQISLKINRNSEKRLKGSEKTDQNDDPESIIRENWEADGGQEPNCFVCEFHWNRWILGILSDSHEFYRDSSRDFGLDVGNED